ncbi:putative membrane protein [Halanaerobium saccharolyticum]|uniref:Putative membrane protein n=1 Tax=Halanaerobium saccharolyticum TaxID=43595 RepID=A0A4R6L947_9FIRM|nr:DUF2177 family protein [Halanaerobium saccharolyticum]TDO71328.1 putative membrane protein [Halanaerobium saccharolyticum]
MYYLKSYLITIVIFFAIDLVWLGAVAKNLYREQLGFLLKDNFNATAAAIFYLFFVAGMLFFVINRAVELSSWQYALFAGAFFGFITYSTYDMTNLATIKDWPVMITVIDIVWGSFLCAATSLISYLLINYFKI